MKRLALIVGFWALGALLFFVLCSFLTACSAPIVFEHDPAPDADADAVESTTGGNSSVSGSTGGELSTGGSLSVSGATGGDKSTGGGSALPTTTAPDLDACPCPANQQCKPVGSACNSSDSHLGQITSVLMCIRSPSRCTSDGFDVYCFQC
jgi:hypothetical protein